MPPQFDPAGTASDADTMSTATPQLPPAAAVTFDMSAPSTRDRNIDTKHSNLAPPASPTLLSTSDQVTDTPAISDAGGAMSALADDLRFTLTVGQALDEFSSARRKVPSERSIQRYCIDGLLAAQKIRTTYGSEWLINDASLKKLIDAQPEIMTTASVAMAPPASPTHQNPIVSRSDTIATGDANDAVATTMATPEGERRTIAEVLIENARLFAQVEGRDAIIVELKEDKSFLREEVREARKTRDDVKNIAERMLDTLKTMAIGRLASPPLRDEPRQADYVEQTDRRSG